MTEAALDRLLGEDDALSFRDLANVLEQARCYQVVAHRLQWLNAHQHFVLLAPDNATFAMVADVAALDDDIAIEFTSSHQNLDGKHKGRRDGNMQEHPSAYHEIQWNAPQGVLPVRKPLGTFFSFRGFMP